MVTNTRPPPQMIDISTLSEPGRYLVLEAGTALESAPSKCPSCGSREWVVHSGREVCSYCRSDR